MHAWLSGSDRGTRVNIISACRMPLAGMPATCSQVVPSRLVYRVPTNFQVNSLPEASSRYSGLRSRSRGCGWSASTQRIREVRKRKLFLVASGEDPSTTSLGYRPVVILPGLGNNSNDYGQLTKDLAARGLQSTVAQVARVDWLRNALGLFDGNYWKGTLKPRPVLDWYLNRVEAAVKEAKSQAPEEEKVSLVAHSAGGWLARLYLGEFGTQDVELLLTLGSPHLPPPRDVPGVVDQTRGLLYYIEDTCPGAFHAEVKYVCVAGKYMKGVPFFPPSAAKTPGEHPQEASVAVTGVGLVTTPELDPVSTAVGALGVAEGEGGAEVERETKVQARIVGQGYKQVCGEVVVWGDGVVPVQAAHLEGAINLSLDGVYHSPVGANEERPWYGSPSVLDEWVPYLLK